MSREYFNLWYRINNDDAHLIWYTDERDGIVVDSDGRIPGFRSTDDLLEYAKGRKLKVDVEGAILHDLDVLVGWLKQTESERVDCSNILAAWNLFEDVSRSVDGRFDPDRNLTKKIYEKLFWGNNLPSVTPKGKKYIPVWTRKELRIMRGVLEYGLMLFRDSVRCR